MQEVYTGVTNTAFLATNAVFGVAASLRAGGQEAVHAREIHRAQSIIDACAAREQHAVALLHQARREIAMLKSPLDESDAENLRISMQIATLRTK